MHDPKRSTAILKTQWTYSCKAMYGSISLANRLDSMSLSTWNWFNTYEEFDEPSMWCKPLYCQERHPLALIDHESSKIACLSYKKFDYLYAREQALANSARWSAVSRHACITNSQVFWVPQSSSKTLKHISSVSFLSLTQETTLYSMCVWDQNTQRTIPSAYKIESLCKNNSCAFMIEAQWNIPDETHAF